MKNKNKFLSIIATCAYMHGISQQAPTGPSPSGTGTVNQANKAWYRGGNAALPGTENIFGTLWNSPIYSLTNNAFRTKLNGDFVSGTQYSINGFGWPAVNTSGYLLLGEDNPTQFGGGSIYGSKGAFSLLHLNGAQSPSAVFTQEFGYRPWMKTGITFTGNTDLMYLGVRTLTTAPEQSEMLVSWSDNIGAPFGPDDFAFRFIGTGSSSVISPILSSENDLDGLHIARFTPTGEMGLGNTFGPIGAPYVRPQNLLHMSIDADRPVFMQITNQNGTGQTSNDGLHIGYGTTGLTNIEASINQKENDRLTLYANNKERIRIMHIGALNNGIPFNPGSLSPNLTRISVSEDPASSVTRPLSLLHLGYNTITPTNDGWRPWMDVGTFTAKGSDNIYVGLKQEIGTDRQDGVISWGDNITGLPAGGPDNFRFIFTSNTAAGDAGSVANGLEALRMTPTLTKGVYTGIGGDITNPYYLGGINPTQTLEVNSWNSTTDPGGSSGLRFTNLTDASPTTPNTGNMGVLAVDAEGDVVYVPGGTGAAVGNYCTTTPNPLIANDYEMPLGGFNYRFTGQDVPFDGTTNIDVVGIGYKCGAPMPAKLSVLQEVGTPVAFNTMTAGMINRDAGSLVGFMTFRAVGGLSDGLNANGNKTNVGGEFNAANAAINYGVRSRALSGGIGISQNYGVFGEAQNATSNYGIYGRSLPGTTTGLGPNYAGFFDGDVVGTSYVTPSDRNLKKDIMPLEKSLDIVSKLNPVSYNFDLDNHKDIGLNGKKQYGFISQEVKEILPDLTSPIVYPALYDNEGNVKREKQEYLGLNYDGFIAILTNAVKEQQTQITELKEMVKSLSGLSVTSNVNSKSVALTDKNAIVLNQNVPNPFAESTVINYNIPTTFTKAQIIFSTLDGKIIKVVEVNTKGAGTLNVFADDLSNGIYTYTLVVDGKTIDTKKMAKQ
jgi:Chaperone of endosialidase